MNYFFRSKNHPEANGRKPLAGEESFRMWTATDEGTLEVFFGRKDLINHASTLLAMLRDDPVLRKECLDAVAGVDSCDFLEINTRKKK